MHEKNVCHKLGHTLRFEISIKCNVKAPDSQSARSSDLLTVRCETGWGTSGEAAVNCMGCHVLCFQTSFAAGPCT